MPDTYEEDDDDDTQDLEDSSDPEDNGDDTGDSGVVLTAEVAGAEDVHVWNWENWLKSPSTASFRDMLAELGITKGVGAELAAYRQQAVGTIWPLGNGTILCAVDQPAVSGGPQYNRGFATISRISDELARLLEDMSTNQDAVNAIINNHLQERFLEMANASDENCHTIDSLETAAIVLRKNMASAAPRSAAERARRLFAFVGKAVARWKGNGQPAVQIYTLASPNSGGAAHATNQPPAAERTYFEREGFNPHSMEGTRGYSDGYLYYNPASKVVVIPVSGNEESRSFVVMHINEEPDDVPHDQAARRRDENDLVYTADEMSAVFTSYREDTPRPVPQTFVRRIAERGNIIDEEQLELMMKGLGCTVVSEPRRDTVNQATLHMYEGRGRRFFVVVNAKQNVKGICSCLSQAADAFYAVTPGSRKIPPSANPTDMFKNRRDIWRYLYQHGLTTNTRVPPVVVPQDNVAQDAGDRPSVKSRFIAAAIAATGVGATGYYTLAAPSLLVIGAAAGIAAGVEGWVGRPIRTLVMTSVGVAVTFAAPYVMNSLAAPGPNFINSSIPAIHKTITAIPGGWWTVGGVLAAVPIVRLIARARRNRHRSRAPARRTSRLARFGLPILRWPAGVIVAAAPVLVNPLAEKIGKIALASNAWLGSDYSGMDPRFIFTALTVVVGAVATGATWGALSRPENRKRGFVIGAVLGTLITSGLMVANRATDEALVDGLGWNNLKTLMAERDSRKQYCDAMPDAVARFASGELHTLTMEPSEEHNRINLQTIDGNGIPDTNAYSISAGMSDPSDPRRFVQIHYTGRRAYPPFRSNPVPNILLGFIPPTDAATTTLTAIKFGGGTWEARAASGDSAIRAAIKSIQYTSGVCPAPH